MDKVRISSEQDIPALRRLWKLAFGDSEAYMDNFFRTYYRPERMLVLEDEGEIRSMTAWFDTTFVVPGRGEYRAAYLYAVATHPESRGKGLAGKLLAGADQYFRSLSIPAVTTVPAEPSLHNFFGSNGFRECFQLAQWELERENLPEKDEQISFKTLSPGEYGQLREELLKEIPHIAYPEEALAYQIGCCTLSGGGVYGGKTSAGPVLLCGEGAGNGVFVVKEILGSPTAKRLGLSGLNRVLPACKWYLREPVNDCEKVTEGWQFAMLKWLEPPLEKEWDWHSFAYLGLAFD